MIAHSRKLFPLDPLFSICAGMLCRPCVTGDRHCCWIVAPALVMPFHSPIAGVVHRRRCHSFFPRAVQAASQKAWALLVRDQHSSQLQHCRHRDQQYSVACSRTRQFASCSCVAFRGIPGRELIARNQSLSLSLCGVILSYSMPPRMQLLHRLSRSQ